MAPFALDLEKTKLASSLVRIEPALWVALGLFVGTTVTIGFVGVAPKCNLVNVKVMGADGSGYLAQRLGAVLEGGPKLSEGPVALPRDLRPGRYLELDEKSVAEIVKAAKSG